MGSDNWAAGEEKKMYPARASSLDFSPTTTTTGPVRFM